MNASRDGARWDNTKVTSNSSADSTASKDPPSGASPPPTDSRRKGKTVDFLVPRDQQEPEMGERGLCMFDLNCFPDDVPVESTVVHPLHPAATQCHTSLTLFPALSHAAVPPIDDALEDLHRQKLHSVAQASMNQSQLLPCLSSNLLTALNPSSSVAHHILPIPISLSLNMPRQLSPLSPPPSITHQATPCPTLYPVPLPSLVPLPPPANPTNPTL